MWRGEYDRGKGGGRCRLTGGALGEGSEGLHTAEWEREPRIWPAPLERRACVCGSGQGATQDPSSWIVFGDAPPPYGSPGRAELGGDFLFLLAGKETALGIKAGDGGDGGGTGQVEVHQVKFPRHEGTG